MAVAGVRDSATAQDPNRYSALSAVSRSIRNSPTVEGVSDGVLVGVLMLPSCRADAPASLAAPTERDIVRGRPEPRCATELLEGRGRADRFLEHHVALDSSRHHWTIGPSRADRQPPTTRMRRGERGYYSVTG